MRDGRRSLGLAGIFTMTLSAGGAAAGNTVPAGLANDFGFWAVQGEPCTLPSDCATGFCTDGVCCDNDCGGSNPDDCQVCSKALSAPADGVCTVLSAAVECRASAGDCDVPEHCDGVSGECPADVVQAAGVQCRASAGVCDVPESCDGNQPVCPINTLAVIGTVCRGAGSECDAIETCDGILLDCPADLPVADSTPCSVGLCQAGVCVPPGNGAGGNGGGSSGSSSSGGEGGSGPEEEGGCGCHLVGSDAPADWKPVVMAFFGMGWIAYRIRRRRRFSF